MLKRAILFLTIFGLVTQTIPFPAMDTLNSCMASLSLTNRQKMGILGLVVAIAVGQVTYAIYQDVKHKDLCPRGIRIPNSPSYEENKPTNQQVLDNHTIIVQKQFEESKNHLSEPLQKFLDDFASWSQEEKNTIYISHPKLGSSGITVNGLSKERQVAYEGCLAQWLEDCLRDMIRIPDGWQPCVSPTIFYGVYLYYLKNCIEYLRQ